MRGKVVRAEFQDFKDETARQQFGTLTLTQPLSPIAYARLKQKITRENYEKLPPPKAFSLVNLTRR